MRILTDLGHPKNVHILNNLIPLLEKKGHEIVCIYRDREYIKELCDALGITGINRGKGASGILGKSLYLVKTDLQLYQLAKKIKPDLLLSFASPYLSSLAMLARIPLVVLDDTEQNAIVQKF